MTGPSADDLRALATAALNHYRAGRLDAAEAAFRTILAHDPANARMRSNLGLLLTTRGAFEEADAMLAAALDAEPANATTRTVQARLRRTWARHLVKGVLPHLDAQEPERAVGDLERAVALAPDDLLARLNLAAVCDRLGRLDEAETHYRAALALAPREAFALRNLRLLLMRQGRNAEALASAQAALAAGETSGEGDLSRAQALSALGDQTAALAAFEAGLARGADVFEALSGMGLARTQLGQYAEALSAFEAALDVRPGDPAVLMRRAINRLRLGDFAGGWDDYEARWRSPDFLAGPGAWASQALSRLAVDPTPESLRGHDVLAVGEQGIGDQVMFASLLPDLIADARQVACACDSRLVRLFASSFPGLEAIGVGETAFSLDRFETLVAIGSLGAAYRRRAEDFPRTAYLRPAPAVRDRWAARLGERPAGLRIGLSWRGGTAQTRTNDRSLPLAALNPVLNLPGCQFVSLQYGDVSAEVAAVNGGLADPIRLFAPEEIDDFEDLAGLVAELDVVVSVQTSLVHLCGALGSEALVLIPRIAEWRYGAEGASMPWYGSVRLFRQGDDRAWEPVVARIADDLRARLSVP